jgi:hypothetical protein
VLRAWIDESYRAVAPKRLPAALGGGPAPAVAPRRAAARRAAPRKPAARAKARR